MMRCATFVCVLTLLVFAFQKGELSSLHPVETYQIRPGVLFSNLFRKRGRLQHRSRETTLLF